MTIPEKPIEEPSFLSSSMSSYQEKEGELYMNANQKEHFRKLLMASEKQFLTTMNRTRNQLQDEAPPSSDLSDQASQEEAFRTRLRTHGREYQLFEKIKKALNKLDAGDSYGYCETCESKIGIRRLEARPTATLCIDCKTLDEIREKQQGN